MVRKIKMNRNYIIIAVSILLDKLIAGGQASCRNGYEIQSERINDVQANGIQCKFAENQRCMRAEGVIDFLGPVNIIVWGCVSSEKCKEECEALIQETSNNVFGDGRQTFSVTSCNRACCGTMDCNSNSLQSLTGNEPSSPSMSTLVTTASNEAKLLKVKTCSSGLFEANTKTIDMGRSICSSSENYCLRMEVTTLTTNGVRASYEIGTCADDSICKENCGTRAKRVFGDESIATESCSMTCCDFDDCNALPVDLLRALSKETSTPVTTGLGPTTSSQSISTQDVSTTEALSFSTSTPLAVVRNTISIMANQANTRESLSMITSSIPPTATASSTDLKNTSGSMSMINSTIHPESTVFRTDQAKTVPSLSVYNATTRPKTITTSTDQLNYETRPFTKACLVGSKLPQGSIASWRSIKCSTSESYGCLRQEVVGRAKNGSLVNATFVACANETVCLNSCEDVAAQFFQDLSSARSRLDDANLSAEKLLSCEMMCCTSNNCNRLPISQLKTETTEGRKSTLHVTATSSIATSIGAATNTVNINVESGSGVVAENKLLIFIFTSVSFIFSHK